MSVFIWLSLIIIFSVALCLTMNWYKIVQIVTWCNSKIGLGLFSEFHFKLRELINVCFPEIIKNLWRYITSKPFFLKGIWYDGIYVWIIKHQLMKLNNNFAVSYKTKLNLLSQKKLLYFCLTSGQIIFFVQAWSLL